MLNYNTHTYIGQYGAKGSYSNNIINILMFNLLGFTDCVTGGKSFFVMYISRNIGSTVDAAAQGQICELEMIYITDSMTVP